MLTANHRLLPADSKPIILARKLEIARKPKIINDPQPEALTTNGLPATGLNGTGAKRKRSPEDSVLDQEHLLKRKRSEADRLPGSRTSGDTIVLDDSGGGAIIIDDE